MGLDLVVFCNETVEAFTEVLLLWRCMKYLIPNIIQGINETLSMGNIWAIVYVNDFDQPERTDSGWLICVYILIYVADPDM